MFGALGTTFGLPGKRVRRVPRQPVGRRAAGAVLRGHGALDVRRLRARAAVGLAAAPVAGGRPRVHRRVHDGPGRRHHRRALHGPDRCSRCSPTSDDARRGLGLRHCSRPTARAWDCRFWLLAAFSVSLPRPGAWMDWVKSVFGILLFLASLYYLKNVVPALAHFTSPSRGSRSLMAAMVVVGVALGADAPDVLRRRAREGAQGLGRRPGDRGSAGRDQLRAHAQGRDRAGLALGRGGGLAQARAAGRPVLVDFSRTGASPAKSSR